MKRERQMKTAIVQRKMWIPTALLLQQKPSRMGALPIFRGGRHLGERCESGGDRNR